MAEDKENPRVQSLMNWVRLMIPLILASLGWYIGQTVGNLNTRLDTVDVNHRGLKEDFLEHRAGSDSTMQEILRRLEKNNSDHELLISKSEFQAILDNADRRINRIEDRLDEHTDE